MTFLNPSAFWFFTLLAIPILLHLLNLQRSRKVFFSNVELLSEVKEQSSRKVYLKKLLLLLTRLLMLTALILAFARPFKKNKGFFLNDLNNAGINVLLDNSLSNSVGSDFAGGIEMHKEKALRISQYLKKSNPTFNLYSLSDKAKNVGLLAFQEELAKIKIDRSRTYFDLEILKAGIGEQQNKLNLVFSDFQKNSLENLNGIIKDTLSNYILFPSYPSSNSNIYIDSLWSDDPVILQGTNVQINASIKNVGSEDRKDLNLSIMKNDNRIGSLSVDIPAQSVKKISFEVSVSDARLNVFKVQFDDFPFTYDNEFFFTCNPIEPINIYHIYSNEESSFNSLFSNENLFSFSEDNSNSINLDRIEKSDLLIIGAGAIRNESVKNLIAEQLIAANHNTVLYVSDTSSLEEYNNFSTEVLNLSTPKIQKDSINVGDYIRQDNLKKEFFKGVFQDKDENLDMPYAKAPAQGFTRIWEKILETKGGYPVFLRKEVGDKYFYIINTILEKDFSDLATSSIFLPMMYKTAFSTISAERPLYFRTNDDFVSIDYSTENNQSIKFTVNGTVSIPYQVKEENFTYIKTQDFLTNTSIFIPFITENYKLDPIVLNSPKEESETVFYTAEELKDLADNYEHIGIYDSDELLSSEGYDKSDLAGHSLWSYFLIAALIFVFVEIAIIRLL